MADVELRLTADTGQATKGISGFRKEYAELVKAVEKPLRQIDALQKTQESAKQASTAFFDARQKATNLQQALEKVSGPAAKLGQSLAQAEKEMTRASAAIDRQKQKLEAQRGTVLATKQALDALKQSQASVDGGAAGKGDTQAMAAAKQAVAAATAEYEKQRTTLSAHRQALAASRASVKVLGDEYQAAAQPVRILETELGKAGHNLARTTQEFDRQKAKVREQRAELKAAGVDTRNLAAEQQRLNAELGKRTATGRNDEALSAAAAKLGVANVRQLHASLKSLDAAYITLTRSSKLSASERAVAEAQYRRQIEQTKAAIRDLSGEQQKQSNEGGFSMAAAKNIALATAAYYAASRAAGSYFASVDKLGELEDRLKLVTRGTEEFAQVQDRLRDISARTYTEYASNAELFLRSVKPLRELGFATGDVLSMTEALSSALVISGVKGERASSIIDQFSKALQTGELRGDAFNAVIMQAPELADALAEGLGVNRQELIGLAEDGALVTEDMIPALIQILPELTKKLDDMRVTAADARTRLKDTFDETLFNVDGMLGATDKVVAGLKGINDAAQELNKEGLWSSAKSLGKSWFVQAAEMTLRWSGIKKEAEKIINERSDVPSDIEQAAQAEATAKEAALDIRRQLRQDLKSEQKQRLDDYKQAIKDQAALERTALSELQKAKQAQLETEKRYTDALAKLRNGSTGSASYGAATSLKVAARQSLADGDIEGAKRHATGALQMLQELAEAGENTYGFEGFIKELQSIESAADGISRTKAEDKLKAIKDQTAELKTTVDAIKDLKITPKMDDQELADARAKIVGWGVQVGKELNAALSPTSALAEGLNPSVGGTEHGQTAAGNTPPRIVQDGPNSFTNLPPVDVDVRPTGIRQDGENSFTNLPPVEVDIVPRGIRQDGENSFTNLSPVEVDIQVDQDAAAVAQQAVESLALQFRRQMQIPIVPIVQGGAATVDPTIPGYAGGGQLQGPGTGTSDDILLWGSNGEYMLRADAVRHYGKAYLDQLNARRIPKFADGGFISSRLAPAVPQLGSSLSQAAAAKADPFDGLKDWGRATLDSGERQVEVLIRRQPFDEIRLAARKYGRTHKG